MSSHPLSHDDALRRRLIALARRWLAQGAEAEDLVQDTYLRTAATALPASDSGREAWLVTVLHHLCIDFLRRQGRYHAILSNGAAEAAGAIGFAGAPEAGGAIANNGLGGAVATAQDEDDPQRLAAQAQRVEAALAHLSHTLAPADAAAVLLYEIFEFSHAELGALAGRSEDASRQHLHRLLRRLRSSPAQGRRPKTDGRDGRDGQDRRDAMNEKDGQPVRDDTDEDAGYLFTLCRHALAQRDPGGLVALLRASNPHIMAVLANTIPGDQDARIDDRNAPRMNLRNLLELPAFSAASLPCVVS
ncbi:MULTISPECIES: RNA polymerase sigma factor [unclassified Achromobacter]|uniref:RNA polymerase sigma factor n=1 Tax=unclassified Achromobacter TaxID=2626865 RepID=UPI001E41E8F5|nr:MULTISPECIES: RNA polymerase sigma factor [unclassified Achromobacter]